MTRRQRLKVGVLATAVGTLVAIATIAAGVNPLASGSDGAVAGDSPVAVDVTTTNLGHLTVTIDASVTAGDQPLTQAQVVAYTDMTEMPLAHTQGPFPMRELAGQPGRYVADTTLPMPGHYEFRVQVQNPVRTEHRRTMFVGVRPTTS